MDFYYTIKNIIDQYYSKIIIDQYYSKIIIDQQSKIASPYMKYSKN